MEQTTKLIITAALLVLLVSISFQTLLTPVEAFFWMAIPIGFAIGAGIGAAKASGGSCFAFIPPTGGNQELCESCQANNLLPCTESRCKSLGQLCTYNKDARKCISKDRGDVTPPRITSCYAANLSLYDFSAQHSSAGCTIKQDIPELDVVFIKIDTDEYSRCRFSPYVGKPFNPEDKDTSWFEEGAIPSREHFFGMRLANGSAEIIKNNCKSADESCNFYVRCQDESGNKNLNDYLIKFKVQPAPDLKSPEIVSVSVPSGVAVPSSLTEAQFYMYVDDLTGLSGCKYSTRDEQFNDMPSSFFCNQTYNTEEHGFECSTTFNLSKERDNQFYFRCQDNSERKNTNEESYSFLIKTSQQLQFTKESLPSGLIQAPTFPIIIETNNKALCYYTLNAGKETIFNQTDSLQHNHNLETENGNHKLIIRCIDEAGNEKSSQSDFKTEYTQTPILKRIYKSSGLLFIQVNQDAKCVYSKSNRNLDFKDGIAMQKQSNNIHQISSQDANALVYYVICRSSITNKDSNIYTIYP